MPTLRQLINRPKRCRTLSNPKTIIRISEKRWQKSNVPGEPQSALGSLLRNIPNLTAANSMGAVNANDQIPGLAPRSAHPARVDWCQARRFAEHVEAGCLKVTVEGNGYDLRRLI